jgi:hypothetical protein
LDSTEFRGWEIEYSAGGDWPGAGSSVSISNQCLGGTFAAWPSGCIDLDTTLLREGEEPRSEHVEVNSEADVRVIAGLFEDRLIRLSRGDRG